MFEFQSDDSEGDIAERIAAKLRTLGISRVKYAVDWYFCSLYRTKFQKIDPATSQFSGKHLETMFDKKTVVVQLNFNPKLVTSACFYLDRCFLLRVSM